MVFTKVKCYAFFLCCTKIIQVGKSSLLLSACVSWHRIQVSSPDEVDKPAVEPGIFTAAQEKDMLNAKGQLKKKIRDSKA